METCIKFAKLCVKINTASDNLALENDPVIDYGQFFLFDLYISKYLKDCIKVKNIIDSSQYILTRKTKLQLCEPPIQSSFNY